MVFATLAALPLAGHAQGLFALLRLDDAEVKWGVPALGRGAVVSYALLDAPLQSPSAFNCKRMVSLDGLPASGLSSPRLSPCGRRWPTSASSRPPTPPVPTS
jgi:hypothetical protein